MTGVSLKKLIFAASQVGNLYVWLDILAIPQCHVGMKSLAVNTLYVGPPLHKMCFLCCVLCMVLCSLFDCTPERKNIIYSEIFLSFLYLSFQYLGPMTVSFYSKYCPRSIQGLCLVHKCLHCHCTRGEP